MGRHTAEPRSVRTPRQNESFQQDTVDQGRSSSVIGERRAALGRPRAERPAARRVAAREATPALPTPVSVADNRVSAPIARGEAALHATTAAESALTAQRDVAARVVRVRRAPVAPPKRPERAVGVTAFLRRRATIPALSFFAVFGFVGGSLVNPLSGSYASAAVLAPTLPSAPAQQFTAHGTYQNVVVTRDGYQVTKPVVVTPKVTAPTTTTTTTAAAASTSTASSAAATASDAAPAAGTPDPGSAKAIALTQVTAKGWGTDQYNCLVSLWTRESSWNVYAYNPSGAYGIPQALPGSKMASVGADWQTNPATQIAWGLGYIQGSYGTPCEAWAHSNAFNWY
ncbi:lytic transglycosylase domain-containing protein [Curtobacterium sp. MCBD17_040]|uniref:lytic transglycosylase domain-containing protein n=1 Tax=Curtobacterium sp. MCBD17_040 TaxID=2175674 RepID=UPI0021AD31BE|nr:lytic transglycosylase domain-containing protein [Curtobacterium sp. MCBD17_040]WIB62433.1 lytic transglycosylase domain-containing protein [Curtobacterium sp. MCBD17_040]